MHVPQGSVLFATLFLLHIYDLLLVPSNLWYADRTSLRLSRMSLRSSVTILSYFVWTYHPTSPLCFLIKNTAKKTRLTLQVQAYITPEQFFNLYKAQECLLLYQESQYSRQKFHKVNNRSQYKIIPRKLLEFSRHN